jgi:hypothetical protein
LYHNTTNTSKTTDLEKNIPTTYNSFNSTWLFMNQKSSLPVQSGGAAMILLLARFKPEPPTYRSEYSLLITYSVICTAWKTNAGHMCKNKFFLVTQTVTHLL